MTEQIIYENQSTIDKALNLFDKLRTKEEFHRKKWDRARKYENQEFHYERMKKYSELRFRCGTLLFALRRNDRFGNEDFLLKYDRKGVEHMYKAHVLKYKLEGNRKFQSEYRIAMWFFSESLRSDYGTHTCDKCESTFHHSPSTVYRGVNKEYECCCGHCVNSLLRWNNQELIYN